MQLETKDKTMSRDMVFIASFLGLYASNVVFLLNTIFVKSHNNTTDKIILALDGISPKVYRWN